MLVLSEHEMTQIQRKGLTLDVNTNNAEEESDVFNENDLSPSKQSKKKKRMRTPSFEGYFTGGTNGSEVVQYANMQEKSVSEKIEEIKCHLEEMMKLFREIDILRMAIRIECKDIENKRYLTVVSSNLDHSAIIGIDWSPEGPSIGTVIPICSTTLVKCDGDGGFHVSRGLGISNVYKPISIQSLWSALQVIQRAYAQAKKKDYYYGIETSGFLEHYNNMISSERQNINTWNELDDVDVVVSVTSVSESAEEDFEAKLRHGIRAIMMKSDLDSLTCKQVRLTMEEELQVSLRDYRKFIDKEIITIMGQLESASEILDYLYLVRISICCQSQFACLPILSNFS